MKRTLLALLLIVSVFYLSSEFTASDDQIVRTIDNITENGELITPASVLSKAGLLEGLRGKVGGYRLSRSPEEYKLGEILRTADGSLAPVSCLDDEVNMCDRQEECVTLILWRKLDDAIKSVIDNVTLADLLEWNEQQNGNYII